MNDTAETSSEPLLRTLAPALRELEKRLRAWLDDKRRYPLSTLQKATLEGLADDLHRQAEALQVDRPLLTIMLMGGTGVGKSTLLNALAGCDIAQASLQRPTTRDPVVYYHESIQPHRLDVALQQCKLASHDRPALEQKILVDTPDLDSNDLANREKLVRLLPVADIVLYVGSQEKYHDKLGWDLFLHHRQRRAFAFVLNKWDRCQHLGASGKRPDDDLLKDLEEEGFHKPLLFRTCAQHWVERVAQSAERTAQNGQDGEPALRASPSALHAPEGEQFLELVRWLEMGLTRLEIEAIKARGVSQMLRHLEQALAAACPPDLSAVAKRTRDAWADMVRDEAQTHAEVLLNTLEPYQKEIEHHFALERQRQFKGVMGTYLHYFNRFKYSGSTLRDHIPFLPKLSNPVNTPAQWDLTQFTQACSSAASDRHLEARGKALANRLLVEADARGFPVALLTEPTEAAAKLDWRGRQAQAMIEVLGQIHHAWSKPTGLRRVFQGAFIFMADWLPLVAAIVMGGKLIWDYTGDRTPSLYDLFVPIIVLILTIIVLHALISLFLPLRWLAIRGDYERRLRVRLAEELEGGYADIPGKVAKALLEERRKVESFVGEIREVGGWLEKKEEAASVAGLYGR